MGRTLGSGVDEATSRTWCTHLGSAPSLSNFELVAFNPGNTYTYNVRHVAQAEPKPPRKGTHREQH